MYRNLSIGRPGASTAGFNIGRPLRHYLELFYHIIESKQRSGIALACHHSFGTTIASFSLTTIFNQHRTRHGPTLGATCSDAPLAAVVGALIEYCAATRQSAGSDSTGIAGSTTAPTWIVPWATPTASSTFAPDVVGAEPGAARAAG